VAKLKKLVIVESPTKARTISRYLGPDFDVEASVGHVRDLPQPSELPASMKKGPYGKFAVDIKDGFEPYYVVEPDKKKKVAELRKALAGADELYLATDEDREGEAIAWHLLQVLKPKVPVKRMVFHEITPEAIKYALAHPREVDDNLVDAQETRRILDRLYGYEVSPVLWRKIRAGLSAGRVQSVATRLIVERERERMAFKAASYWDLAALFETLSDAGPRETFPARLQSVDGSRLAQGKDFDDSGQLKSKDVVAFDQAGATALVEALAGAQFVVDDLTSKPYSRRPAPPFTTSTLQQEASRKLRLNSRATMRIAQRLYEQGHITYMRTDSTHLAEEAIAAARRQATQLYGADSIPQAPRVYQTHTKGAQEAHEAIRPSGDKFVAPDELAGKLSPEELKLYDLIWKRAVACQMVDAKGHTMTVKIKAAAKNSGGAGARECVFAASGTVITQRGFLAAYEEGQDAARYAEEKNEARLPDLTVGQKLDAKELTADGHETTPPPRYTEASLVAALEKRGIGRPSTYAATVSVIEDRGYARRKGMALVPTWLAFAVTKLLEEHFKDLVDYDFTAEMENGLDRIAAGEEPRVQWLSAFYFGTDPEAKVTGHDDSLVQVGLKRLVEEQGDIDAREVNTVPLGDGIDLRVGRYGPSVEEEVTKTGDKDGEKSTEPVRASVPQDLAPDELTPAKAKELIAQAVAGAAEQRVLGNDPATGRQIIVKDGRFGPYVTELMPEDSEGGKKKGQLKPRNASLFKSMSPETVSLDDALRLLGLPRELGKDDDGNVITAQNGRYGPYIKCGSQSRSLESEDEIFTVTLDKAKELLATPRPGRGARASAALRELGVDSETGLTVTVKDGRFGPYVTDGKTNATLRKDDEAGTVTLERAQELLAEKRARGPVKRTTRARKKTTK
jgi:DNA topoisomerase-1